MQTRLEFVSSRGRCSNHLRTDFLESLFECLHFQPQMGGQETGGPWEGFSSSTSELFCHFSRQTEKHLALLAFVSRWLFKPASQGIAAQMGKLQSTPTLAQKIVGWHINHKYKGKEGSNFYPTGCFWLLVRRHWDKSTSTRLLVSKSIQFFKKIINKIKPI